MIYTLTMNPSLDYITKVEEVTLGAVNRSYQEEMFAGGKGINVSTILTRLKNPSTAIGFLAGFTGEEIERKTKVAGINTHFIKVKDGISRINVKIKSVEETEINGGGPTITEADLHQLFTYLQQLGKEDILILAGSIPPSVPSDIYRKIMDKLASTGVKVIVDTTGETLLDTLPMHPFLIKPNIHELEEVIGKALHTQEEIVEAGRYLQQCGAQNVLISCGGDGALLVTSEEVYQCQAPKGKVQNSTGAGDSMVAGFVSGYLRQGSYQEALYWGIAAGSATAFSLDLASQEQIENMYQVVERDNTL